MFKIGPKFGDLDRENIEVEWLVEKIGDGPKIGIDADDMSQANQDEWLANFVEPYEVWRFTFGWDKYLLNRAIKNRPHPYAVDGYCVVKDDQIVGWYVVGRA